MTYDIYTLVMAAIISDTRNFDTLIVTIFFYQIATLATIIFQRGSPPVKMWGGGGGEDLGN